MNKYRSNNIARRSAGAEPAVACRQHGAAICGETDTKGKPGLMSWSGRKPLPGKVAVPQSSDDFGRSFPAVGMELSAPPGGVRTRFRMIFAPSPLRHHAPSSETSRRIQPHRVFRGRICSGRGGTSNDELDSSLANSG